MTDSIFNRKVSLVPIEQLVGPIRFGWSTSPFGKCLILLQSDTVIGIAFKNNQSDNKIETSIKSQLSDTTAKFEPFNTDKKAENIFFENGPIKISFSGTQFQTTIWKKLFFEELQEIIQKNRRIVSCSEMSIIYDSNFHFFFFFFGVNLSKSVSDILKCSFIASFGVSFSK